MEGQAWWEWLKYCGKGLPGMAALADAMVVEPGMRGLESLELR